MHGTQGPLPQPSPERKYRRFDLHLPVSLRFPWGTTAREMTGVSKNVSMGGLLVQATGEIPLRTKVRLTMNVLGPRSRRAVRIRGQGEVVRVEPLGTGAGFAIAVKCNRPLTEIQSQLPAAEE
jgi:hypothetical protein